MAAGERRAGARDPRTGGVIGALGSCYDITESKLAEIALHESRSTLLTVAESSADVLALFDRQRKCVFLNRSIPGLTPDPWLGAPVEDFAPPEDRARVHDIFERVIHTGASEDFEQVFTDSAHRLRCLEMRVRAVQSGDRMLGAVVNITEVTEQRAQRDTLRDPGADHRDDARRRGARGCGLDDRAPHQSTFERLFGYRTGELIGRRSSRSSPCPGISARNSERLFRELQPCPAARRRCEMECVRKDGSRFVASCVISPLSMGGTDHWIAVVNDITEKKRLERGIIDIANREQQRIGSDLHDGSRPGAHGHRASCCAACRRSSARKSSELTPRRRGHHRPRQQRHREHAHAGARAFARERGARRPHGGAARARRARQRALRRARRVPRYDLARPLPLNDVYATHLYRIAQEALTNVVRRSYASEVTICLEDVGEELQLRIDDNGRGFAQTPQDSAVGLGLKMMRYRAQMLGGDLVLEASADGGASVRCTCPVEP